MPRWSFLLIAQFVLEPDGGIVPIKFFLFFLAHFAGENLLIIYGGLCLLSGLFDARFHPVLVVTGRPNVFIFKRFRYVTPNFTVLEVWVKLNNLH